MGGGRAGQAGRNALFVVVPVASLVLFFQNKNGLEIVFSNPVTFFSSTREGKRG
jgi:hypothetical protein